MPVMRSVFYVPSNNEKMVGKAPTIACDVLTLDLEDSVPPAEKPKGREMIQQLSLIHISEPTRLRRKSRMPSSA